MNNLSKAILYSGLLLHMPLLGADEPGQQGKNIDELDPKALLEKLKSDGETEIRIERGWIVASSKKLRTVWSFPPAGHPAYPSCVKRAVVEGDGSIYVDSSVKCGAEKAECDNLVKDFIELNDSALKPVQ